MKDSTLQIGIIGKYGYTFIELEKLLAKHPAARIVAQHSAHENIIVPPEVMAEQCDFDEMYHDKPLVQYIKEIPEMNAVANTDLCQISVWVQAGVIKVMAVLDNLRKGAAAQAVQNMNLMFGLS